MCQVKIGARKIHLLLQEQIPPQDISFHALTAQAAATTNINLSTMLGVKILSLAPLKRSSLEISIQKIRGGWLFQQTPTLAALE